MHPNESTLRAAFTSAEQGLNKAIATYNDARTAMRAAGCDTTMRDERVSLKFSTAGGSQAAQDIVKTDC